MKREAPENFRLDSAFCQLRAVYGEMGIPGMHDVRRMTGDVTAFELKI